MIPKQLEDVPARALANLLSQDIPVKPWTDNDLHIMWQQLLSLPVWPELQRAGADTPAVAAAYQNAQPPIVALRDVIGHPAVPAYLLDALRRSIKQQADELSADASSLPLLALYYALLATGLCRGTSSTKLTQDQLAKGLTWASRHSWIDSRTRELLQTALGRLAHVQD